MREKILNFERANERTLNSSAGGDWRTWLRSDIPLHKSKLRLADTPEGASPTRALLRPDFFILLKTQNSLLRNFLGELPT
ncbi:hypothetical protein BZZ01_06525 [Nostocales cyanobacterium HT-58-2]|nr:hypothetical protein BZZ01_06525 [Nostocales cyanobacterium HT-58-2]